MERGFLFLKCKTLHVVIERYLGDVLAFVIMEFTEG